MLSKISNYAMAALAALAGFLAFRLRGAQLNAVEKELTDTKRTNNVQAATSAALVENEKHEIEELAHAMDSDNPFGDDGMRDR